MAYIADPLPIIFKDVIDKAVCSILQPSMGSFAYPAFEVAIAGRYVLTVPTAAIDSPGSTLKTLHRDFNGRFGWGEHGTLTMRSEIFIHDEQGLTVHFEDDGSFGISCPCTGEAIEESIGNSCEFLFCDAQAVVVDRIE